MDYDDEMLQQINDNANLIEYVQNTGVELKPRGDNLFAHCPLHIDDTPSLSFSPTKNSFHCFSCGAKGQMIGYLMKFENMDFQSAVEKAAGLANVDMSKMCQSKTLILLKRWKSLLKSKQNKKIYAHPIIPMSEFAKFSKEEVTEWLEEGISQNTMNLFDIRVDNDSNRIVYPVYDINGNLINIKGRTRYENYKKLKLPKYINYYAVGVMDYFQGLEKTKKYIKEQNEVIIFESIKSVMKAYGWGYKNCVSAEKHTLTPEQISLLVELGVNVVFAYDSDVSYNDGEVKENLDVLRKITNVYVISDKDLLLGGCISKNAPVDCGLDVWEELYFNKRKVV